MTLFTVVLQTFAEVFTQVFWLFSLDLNRDNRHVHAFFVRYTGCSGSTFTLSISSFGRLPRLYDITPSY